MSNIVTRAWRRFAQQKSSSDVVKWVSLGSACDIAMILKEHKQKRESYPFDWLWNLDHGLSAVNDMITSDFRNVIREDSYTVAYHYRLNREVVVYKEYPSIIHMHSNPYSYREDHDVLRRRIERFKDLLQSNDPITFVHYKNYNEELMKDKSISLEEMFKGLVLKSNEFLKLIEKKRHRDSFVLIVVLQTDPKWQEQANKLISSYRSKDHRVRYEYTISRIDGDDDALATWRRQWNDILGFGSAYNYHSKFTEGQGKY